MKLALDNHYSPAIARALADQGLDVVTAVGKGWQTEPDGSLLDLCRGERRALLTNNVADFVALANDWRATGRTHSGLIFTADAALPRTRATIGTFVRLLGDLMRANPDDDALADAVMWLNNSADGVGRGRGRTSRPERWTSGAPTAGRIK